MVVTVEWGRVGGGAAWCGVVVLGAGDMRRLARGGQGEGGVQEGSTDLYLK